MVEDTRLNEAVRQSLAEERPIACDWADLAPMARQTARNRTLFRRVKWAGMSLAAACVPLLAGLHVTVGRIAVSREAVSNTIALLASSEGSSVAGDLQGVQTAELLLAWQDAPSFDWQ